MSIPLLYIPRDSSSLKLWLTEHALNPSKMIGGKAPMALAIMWSLVAITWVFVILRLYTRIFIIQSVGPDDHTYWLSGVLILPYTVFVRIASLHGFGRPMPSIGATPSEFDEAALAIKTEMIGQTFAVVGMAVAKLSLGFFLIRIVVDKWQRMLIWFTMVSLSAVSTLCAVLFWTQCTPVQKIFDPIRTEGVCNFNITPFATTLGDFFFAIFSWVFIWKLNMKQKEKIMIAGSMSFGFVAGACGIVRTFKVSNGFTANYTLDTVPLIIWSAAEMAVTLICIGIPVLRPLWRRVIHNSNLSSERYYRKQEEVNNDQAYDMDNIPQSNGNRRGFNRSHPKLGIRGPGTTTRIAGDNKSDESILGRGFRQDAGSSPGFAPEGIHVKQDVHVDYSTGLDSSDYRS